MRIRRVDFQNQRILVEIPLTTHTGKIRIKERRSYTDFGIPVATRRKPFNQNMYVEWQIGYDIEIGSKRIHLSTLANNPDLTFVAYNNKPKTLYELSEYLYYFYRMGVISEEKLREVKNYVENIPDSSLLENIYRIYKSNPVEKEINGILFLESVIKYPHLIHDFNNGFFIIAEITIKEKQKAVGIQPMVYICFPVSYLKDELGNSLIGRTAKPNEVAIFEFNRDNAFVILESFKIFGLLSKAHRHDTQEILRLILLSSK